MIDLSDILKPVDITVMVIAGNVEVKCRSSLFEKIAEDIKETGAIYGFQVIAREKDSEIFCSTWLISADAPAIAKKIAEYYAAKGNTVSLML